MYEVESTAFAPENVIAGDFPIVTDFGVVKNGTVIRKLAPVVQGEDGIEELTADTLDKLMGIAAEESRGGEVVYYLTGEFFAQALVLPDGVTVKDIKPALRKLGIFLKELNGNA